MRARVLGITYHLPERVETNDDLARENPDWELDRIAARSGIVARRIAAEGETAADLAVPAAQALLARDLVDPAEIDFLLFCTQSPDHLLPASACLLQHRLGLGTHVGALDFNLGCSGFIFGLKLASCLITAGEARSVLLVTADTCSKYVNRRDRSLRALIGDGAAAALIGAARDGDSGIGSFVVGTDGSGGESLIVPAGGLRLPHSPDTAVEHTDELGCTRSADNLYMNGPAILSFALTTVPKAVARLLQQSQLGGDEIDWYVFHQANRLMLESLASRSNVPPDKLIVTMEEIGNTVSATIPIAIERSVEEGRIKPGHRLLLAGFGVGYSWAACTLTW